MCPASDGTVLTSAVFLFVVLLSFFFCAAGRSDQSGARLPHHVRNATVRVAQGAAAEILPDCYR